MVLAFWLAKLTKKVGVHMLEAKIGNTEADQLGRPVRPVRACAVRVELEFVLWNPFVTQFGRDTTSPAYKYKGHG